jgi:hypothetical protein
VPNFLFLALWCVLANVSQNCNGTWQRHNWAVCFGKRQKITVSYSKFSQKKNISCQTKDMFIWNHGRSMHSLTAAQDTQKKSFVKLAINILISNNV